MLVYILSAIVTFFIFKKIIMPIVHIMIENDDKNDDKNDNDGVYTGGGTDFFHPETGGINFL